MFLAVNFNVPNMTKLQFYLDPFIKNVTENSQDRSGSWCGKKLVVMCLQQQRTYSANKLNLQKKTNTRIL